MASDYQAITRQNEVELGTKTSTRKTQICMYSDPAHFIYELLQNADDYGATEVSFALTSDALTIEHNGKPFTTANVHAITSFGESTSRDDMLKTGRFGVGFKSVFAFTASPIIISGEEHFRVHGLYRVDTYPYPLGFSPIRTRIVLPFNHVAEKPDYVEDIMTPEAAHLKIAARLTGLNMKTLLFTKNLREIRWQTEDSSGHYLREDTPRDDNRITTITDGVSLAKYLVFHRPISWHTKVYKPVEIAFGLDEKNQIVPWQETHFLYVLFATAQETHLQFLINGPYRTNPSRETISEDDPFNCHLISETSHLLGATLETLREAGQLTTQFLGVLPNPDDGLRPFYKPLLENVLHAFHVKDLVPTDDNGYATATSVLQGPAPLREVITKDELPFMAGSSVVCWAKGVVQNTRPDQFLKGLKIRQWGWAELQEVLEKKFGGSSYYHHDVSQADAKWLAARPDIWMQKLYVLLADAIKKSDCRSWSLQRCLIVRVTENDNETHVPGPKAYFPKGKSYADLPQVKRTVLHAKLEQTTKKIEDALVALGVKEIGDEERIDLILDTFYSEGAPSVGREQHLNHMRTFILWWKKEKETDKFTDREIFKVSGEESPQKPADCYIDSPLQASGLSLIYGTSLPGIEPKHRLWSRYKEISSEGFCEFAAACGVLSSLPIVQQSCCRHPNEQILRQDYNRSGVRYTDSAIDNDYIIPALTALLKANDIRINALIWRTMCSAAPDKLEAAYRPNQRYSVRKDKSSLVMQLTTSKWIPDAKGTFHAPPQISKNELHPDFKPDNRNYWLDAIGFGEEAKTESAEYKRRMDLSKELGLDHNLLELLRDTPATEREEMRLKLERSAAARRRLESVKAKPLAYHQVLAGTFARPGSSTGPQTSPTGGSSPNPERRRERTSTEISAAIEAEPYPDTRTFFGVCKKWKGKDDAVRVQLLEWYAGQCQICSETFIRRSGGPYFEGLYLVPYTRAEWIDRVGNVLCVCPKHSAMLQFGPLESDPPIVTQILEHKTRAEGGTTDHIVLKLTLCHQPVQLRFTENHFIDLQEMVKASQKESFKVVVSP